MRVFIDSNIPMCVAGPDHPLREPARRFGERVRAAEYEACTSTEVPQEILYRYSALRRRDLVRQVPDLFVLLCLVAYPVMLADTERAKQLIGAAGGVGVRDAVHAAVMLNNDVHEIATFETGFDVISELHRLPLE